MTWKSQDAKIAFICYSDSAFVEQDYALLSKHFLVTKVKYNAILDVFKIAKAVRRSDISFSWFADGWAFFAVLSSKLFRKKSVIVVGGYEVACEPEICYGVCTLSKLRQWMTTFALNNADMLLPVSKLTKTECFRYLQYPKDLSVVYNAVDTEKFKTNNEGRDNLVITVASGGGSNSVIKLKGISTFIECASCLPELQFIVIGLSKGDLDTLKAKGTTSNVRLLPQVSQDELVAWYQKAKVYCQLSYRESFGMALAEAMACGCVPVVTDRGAMQEVVADTGYVCKYGDPESVVNAIKKALEPNIGNKARKRIVANFSIKKREAELINHLRSLNER